MNSWIINGLFNSLHQVFLLNVLNVVGMFFFVVYAGCGFSSLPYGMIRGGRNVFTRRADVDVEISNVEAQGRKSVMSRVSEHLREVIYE